MSSVILKIAAGATVGFLSFHYLAHCERVEREPSMTVFISEQKQDGTKRNRREERVLGRVLPNEGLLGYACKTADSLYHPYKY